jgi:hypothetical protein
MRAKPASKVTSKLKPDLSKSYARHVGLLRLDLAFGLCPILKFMPGFPAALQTQFVGSALNFFPLSVAPILYL